MFLGTVTMVRVGGGGGLFAQHKGPRRCTERLLQCAAGVAGSATVVADVVA